MGTSFPSFERKTARDDADSEADVRFGVQPSLAKDLPLGWGVVRECGKGPRSARLRTESTPERQRHRPRGPHSPQTSHKTCQAGATICPGFVYCFNPVLSLRYDIARSSYDTGILMAEIVEMTERGGKRTSRIRAADLQPQASRAGPRARTLLVLDGSRVRGRDEGCSNGLH